jgi:hypothetical protein
VFEGEVNEEQRQDHFEFNREKDFNPDNQAYPLQEADDFEKSKAGEEESDDEVEGSNSEQESIEEGLVKAKITQRQSIEIIEDQSDLEMMRMMGLPVNFISGEITKVGTAIISNVFLDFVLIFFLCLFVSQSERGSITPRLA